MTHFLFIVNNQFVLFYFTATGTVGEQREGDHRVPTQVAQYHQSQESTSLCGDLSQVLTTAVHYLIISPRAYGELVVSAASVSCFSLVTRRIRCIDWIISFYRLLRDVYSCHVIKLTFSPSPIQQDDDDFFFCSYLLKEIYYKGQ